MLFKSFRIRMHNAFLAVQQIKDGEWVLDPNRAANEHLTARRNGAVMWLGNGPFYLSARKGSYDADKPCYFGLFWRHYVWWAAARKMKMDADKEKYGKNDETPILF